MIGGVATMRESSTPAVYVADPGDNLVDDIYEHAARSPDHPAFSRRVRGEWVTVTSQEVADRVTRVAAGLVAVGVQPGDRVALLSRTSYEWMVCDYAIWAAGAVTVPVYETSSAEQISWIFRDSGAVAAFVETEDHAKTVAEVQLEVPALRDVW